MCVWLDMTVRLLFLEDFLGFIRNLNRVLDEGGGLKDSFGGWDFLHPDEATSLASTRVLTLVTLS